MGIDHYGSFVFVQSIAMIAFALSTLQYWQGLLVEVPGKIHSVRSLKRQILRSVVFELIGMLVAMTVLGVMMLPMLHISQIANFTLTDVMLAVVSAILPSLGSLVAFYRLTNKYQILLVAGICGNLLRLLLLTLASFWSPSPSTVIVCYAVPELCRLLFLGIFIYFQEGNLDDSSAVDTVDDRKILSVGKWSMVQTIADLPVANVDKVLVAIALSPEALGIYNILKRLYSVISMATSPIYTNSIPEFAHKINTGDRHGAFALWRKTILMLLPVSSCIGLLAFFTRPWWIPIIYKGLAQYSLELLIVILTAIIAGSFITTHAIYWALGRRRETTVITVITNICYLLFLLLFSHFYGIAGALSAFLLHVTLIVLIKVLLLLKEKDVTA